MKIYSTDEISNKIKRRKRIGNIVKIITYPIIIIILLCNIWVLLQKIKNPDTNVNLFGYKAFIIVSGSMEPNLNIGDIVIIKHVEQNEIQKGDIITFLEGEYAVTHRVLDIIQKDGENYYQTKGDNNTAKDKDLVKYENIEGVCVQKISKIGKIITGSKNTAAIIIIVCIICLIYNIISIKDNRRSARHEKRKEFERKNDD